MFLLISYFIRVVVERPGVICCDDTMGNCCVFDLFVLLTQYFALLMVLFHLRIFKSPILS